MILMYKILKKQVLSPAAVSMHIHAPLVAAKAQPGQFIILRVDGEGERIPLTVAETDPAEGSVRIIFQPVGATTDRLNRLGEGDFISDFAGPLGEPTELEGLKNVCIIGGGVGCAIALPIARRLHEMGAKVTSVVGFRTKELVILEDEFAACSDRLSVMTDDGSYGQHGNVTAPLRQALENGERYDRVITIGPLVMMKFVTLTAKEFGVPVTVSMNPIMIDGTGMCGGCRLTLLRDGKRVTKFACVDGPDFDGYEVDFDEAMSRGRMYAEFEARAREENCRLFESAEGGK